MQAAKGVVKVTVTSAEPLKKKQLESLQAAILTIAGKDKTIDLNVNVNENILGGLQVLIGDKFLDLSVGSRITTLAKTLDSVDA
jgi:F0F1-type ATP synthase delta subunit